MNTVRYSMLYKIFTINHLCKYDISSSLNSCYFVISTGFESYYKVDFHSMKTGVIIYFNSHTILASNFFYLFEIVGY